MDIKIRILSGAEGYHNRKENKELSSVALRFISKHPHNTMFLEVHKDEDEEPNLFEDLELLGWKQDGMKVPPIDGRVRIYFGKTGSAMFKEWTPEEKRINMTDVRTVLRKHGFTGVLHHKLSLADLL